MRGETQKAWTARTKDAIKVALDRAMVTANVNAPELADALTAFDDDVDESKVRNWRRAATLLPMHLAQPVARALGMTDSQSDPRIVEQLGYDPMVMVRLYGLTPRSAEEDRLLARSSRWPQDPGEVHLIERLRVLERIELQLADDEDLLAEFEHNRAAQIVLHAVVDSHKYAVAFWPVHAGPSERPEHRLHVSDRVDLRRLDGQPTDETAVWEDLGEALSRARALSSSSLPRWTGSGDELPVFDPHVSMWNLRRLDVPRRPRVPYPHHHFPAVVFSSTVSSTWVGNLAALVALVLGYGVSSTTDLGRQLGGDSRFKPDTLLRNRVHSELLRNPGERRIWFHAAKGHNEYPTAPWAPLSGAAQAGLVHIRLSESDELLAATAEDRSHYPDFSPADELEWRASRDRANDTQPNSERVLRLDVEHVAWGSSEKWRDTFKRARTVLRFLEGLGLEPWSGLERAQQRWVEDDIGLTRPAFSWLRAHAAPFVYAPNQIGQDPTASGSAPHQVGSESNRAGRAHQPVLE